MTSGSPRNGNNFFQLTRTVDPIPDSIKIQFEPQSMYGFRDKVYYYGARLLGIAAILSQPEQNIYCTLTCKKSMLTGTVGAEFYRFYMNDENWFTTVLMMQQRCRFPTDVRIGLSEVEFFERWSARRADMLRIMLPYKNKKANWMKEGF